MDSQGNDEPRVLVVHDYITQRGGAERVVLSLLEAFPGSPVLTSIYDPDRTFPQFRDHEVRTLWPSRVKLFRDDPRRAMPVLAQAFSSAKVPNEFDVVVCSSSGWAHGVNVDAPKVVYCHTPARWLYETADYLPEVPGVLRPGVRAALPLLRRWDVEAAAGAASYVANSSVVRARIRRAYGRDAEVVFPPVTVHEGHEPVPGLLPNFLLVVSRARGYKHVQNICEAVEGLPDERLVVVGGLPDRPGGGAWSNRLVGLRGVPDAQLRWLYANAGALVAVSHEDFGLTPIEAYSEGTPSVLLRAGGYLDSSVEGVTTVFVDGTDAVVISDGIRRLRAAVFDADAIRVHARQFDESVFHARIRAAVQTVLR